MFTTLTDMIGERDIAVRLAVLQAIHDVDFGAPFIIPKSLGAALDDESPEVRAASASALCARGLGSTLMSRHSSATQSMTPMHGFARSARGHCDTWEIRAQSQPRSCPI